MMREEMIRNPSLRQAGERVVILAIARSFMVSVEFKAVGAGTCSWCRKEKAEVFTIAVGDGTFKGRVCRVDMCNLLLLKLGEAREKAGDGPVPSASANGPGSRPSQGLPAAK